VNVKKVIMIVVMGLSVAAASGTVLAQTKGQPGGESFVLSGVLHVEGGGGLAYLQEPTLTNNAIVAVRQGAKIGPYKLTKIFEDRVELEGPSGTILVPLYGGGGGTAVATAPAGSKSAENQTAQPPATEGGAPVPNVLQKIYAGNPYVHYYPVGSPNRNQGIGAIFTALPKSK
jgi:hypothetical protein